MKVYLHIAYLALAVAAIALPGTSVLAQSAAPKGNAENGHKIFNSVGCYQCHGYVGQGGGAAGPALAKTKLPFAAFLQQLRKPTNQMPPYEAVVLPDQTAADIFAFLASLPDPVDMTKVTLPH